MQDITSPGRDCPQIGYQKLTAPAWMELLNQSGVQPSEKQASLRYHGGLIIAPLTPREHLSTMIPRCFREALNCSPIFPR